MRISRTHALGKDEAKRRVDKLADALGSQLGVNGQWCDDQLDVSGSGVNGHIIVADDTIDVDVQLGFALMLMEGTIRSAIEDAMDKHLA
ncbi:MAG: polyhydroxyalkanoic acid system protein [Woeseia sp.]|nr:polyhydroxyalkanoic acid system family protein [Woeseia sp.]NNE61367.1 polyhydroxyalkanoic acid system protein [Woeseia sp.]